MLLRELSSQVQRLQYVTSTISRPLGREENKLERLGETDVLELRSGRERLGEIAVVERTAKSRPG
jgi:hypothetical protein